MVSETPINPIAQEKEVLVKQQPFSGTLKSGSGAEAGTENTFSSFTPFEHHGVTFKNRYVVSPMCTYSCVDGYLTDWHLAHYGAFALQCAGGIVVEATAVDKHGRISPNCPGLWEDGQIAMHKRMVELIHSQGTVAAIQLAHSGRKGSTWRLWEERLGCVPESEGGWPSQLIAPSPVKFSPDLPTPTEISGEEEIAELCSKYADAARRAHEAGYDIVELHFAHGYLVSQFLTQESNRRTDAFGGDLASRCRFAVQVASAVRAVFPAHKPLWARISTVQWPSRRAAAAQDPTGQDGSLWSIEDSIFLCNQLKEVGVDLIDCSSSGISSKEVVSDKPLFQVEFANTIKHAVGISTGAVGRITTGHEAENIIKKNMADIVLIGRAFLGNPGFVKLAAKQIGAQIVFPVQEKYGVINAS